MDAPVKKRSKSGLITVLVIFLFGGIFVGGLFLNARFMEEPIYRASTPGVPAQPLFIITCNLKWTAPSQTLTDEMKTLRPDFVLLQQVMHKDAEMLAAALEMRHEGKLQLYYSPTNPNTKDVPGNAILARHPIFQGRAIAKKGATDAGVWVEPVISKKRFLLGCVDLSPPALPAPAAKLRQEAIDALVNSWKSLPGPFLIGGTVPGDVGLSADAARAPYIDEAHSTAFLYSRDWPDGAAMPRTVGDISYTVLIFANPPPQAR